MSAARGTYRRRAHVRFRVVDGEAVVLLQEEAEVLVLNDVGTRILELVEAGAGRDDVVERLLAEFEVTRTDVEADVDAFLAELVAGGVLAPALDGPG